MTISRVAETLAPRSKSELAELQEYLKTHPEKSEKFDGFGKAVDEAK